MPQAGSKRRSARVAGDSSKRKALDDESEALTALKFDSQKCASAMASMNKHSCLACAHAACLCLRSRSRLTDGCTAVTAGHSEAT